MRTRTSNISKEDFIIWNNKEDKPVEDYDIVYHYTSIIEIINDNGFRLGEGEEIRPVAGLSLKWQAIISEAIEQTK